MSKSRSHTDQAAIFQHAFNEELGALEVVLVGADLKFDTLNQSISVDNTQLESKMDVLIGSIKDVTNCGQSSSERFLKYIESLPKTEAPKVVAPQKEIQIVEVPKIIVEKEIQIVEVTKEIPVQVPGPTKVEVVTVTVEKQVPVIVTQTEYKDLPKLLVAALVLQGLVPIVLALLHK